jgi:hypothetical protein
MNGIFTSVYSVLGGKLASEGWTREMLAQLCEIRLLPETTDCPKEEQA